MVACTMAFAFEDMVIANTEVNLLCRILKALCFYKAEIINIKSSLESKTSLKTCVNIKEKEFFEFQSWVLTLILSLIFLL